MLLCAQEPRFILRQGPGTRDKSAGAALQLLSCLAMMVLPVQMHAQATRPALDIVNQMVQAETAAARDRAHFLYRRKETSTRTKGHQWEELVVEVPEGRMHRLIRVDGKPLTASQEKSELDRLDYLAKHPDDVRRENQNRKDDETRTADLLRVLPKIYLFAVDGAQDGCTRIAFKPNPAYEEQTYQDRVLHASAGYLLIHPNDDRLCKLDTHLEHPVEFGYGFLGKVSQDSRFFMARREVAPEQWKTQQLQVHIDGNILLLKSVSRQEDSWHFGFQEVPFTMSVKQAAAMLESTKY
jgi:hypothetical protein